MLESPVEKEIVEDIKKSSPDCLQQNENMGSQQEVRIYIKTFTRNICFNTNLLLPYFKKKN